MKAWLYYTRLAVLDLVRLWSTTQHHVVIIAGICLPILLLLGLKRGHVADLRRDLVTSPTARQVELWSAQQGELLTPAAVERLEQEIPNTELIIPESQRLVQLSPLEASNGAATSQLATLYATRPGDPLLAALEADVVGPAERAIVVSQSVADSLHAAPGKDVRLTVQRGRSGAEESASVTVRLKAVLPDGVASSLADGTSKTAIAYADIQLLDRLEQYVRGFTVADLQWPAQKASVADRYASYLVFCEATNPLSPDDVALLQERGLDVETVVDPQVKTLYGLLKPESVEKLRVYLLHSATSQTDAKRRLALPPSEISEATAADDVVLPWNGPQEFALPSGNTRLIGVSLPKRTWLREYLRVADSVFDYDAAPATGKLLGSQPGQPQQLPIPLGPKASLPVALAEVKPEPPKAPKADPPKADPKPNPAAKPVKPTVPAAVSPTTAPKPKELPEETVKPAAAKGLPKAPAAKAPAAVAPAKASAKPPVTEKSLLAVVKSPPAAVSEKQPAAAPPAKPPTAPSAVPLLVVPAPLLAQLDAWRNGLAVYDPLVGLLVPVPVAPIYGKARLYARSIDDVPAAVAALAARKFAFKAEDARIAEIQQQDYSLQILVYVVGIGVFVFGVITVVSVLLDSTDRKRGAIGILRVMGMSRSGVFYVVSLRAAVIGVLAGATSIACGYAMAVSLAKPLDSGTMLDAYKPVVTVLIDWSDVVLIAAGALLCSGVGALWPAWKASRLDPFDAIVEGRFR